MLRRTFVFFFSLLVFASFPAKTAENQPQLTDKSVRAMLDAGLVLLQRDEAAKAAELYSILVHALPAQAEGPELTKRYASEAYAMHRIAQGIARGKPVTFPIHRYVAEEINKEEELKAEAAPAIPSAVADLQLKRAGVYIANYFDGEAEEILDDILSTFQLRTGLAIQEITTRAWFLKLLLQDGTVQSAISLKECVPALMQYNTAVNGYLDTRDPALLGKAVEALAGKAAIFRRYGSPGAVLGVYSLLEEYSSVSDDASMRKYVLDGALLRADTAARRGEYEEAVAAYVKLIENTVENDVQINPGMKTAAQLHMATALVMTRKWAEANRILNHIITEYTASDIAEERRAAVYALVGRALVAVLEDGNDVAPILFSEAERLIGNANALFATQGIELGHAMLAARAGEGEDYFGNVTPDAIKPFDAVLAETKGAVESEEVRRRVKALDDKAETLARLGDDAQVQSIYFQIISEFFGREDPIVQEFVAVAMHKRLMVLAKVAPPDEVSEARNRFIERFRDSDSPKVCIAVADEMVRKIGELVKAEDYSAALAACDDLTTRFSVSDEPEVRFSVLRAMDEKARLYSRNDPESARGVLEEIIATFGRDTHEMVKVFVLSAENRLSKLDKSK